MKKENKIQRQEPTPIGFYSVCFYSLASKAYVEENRHFSLKAKTYEGIVNKIKAVYETEYLNDKSEHVYEELKGCYPHEHPTHFTFDAAYTFGPEVHYEIFIKEIYSEDLTD